MKLLKRLAAAKDWWDWDASAHARALISAILVVIVASTFIGLCLINIMFLPITLLVLVVVLIVYAIYRAFREFYE